MENWDLVVHCACINSIASCAVRYFYCTAVGTKTTTSKHRNGCGNVASTKNYFPVITAHQRNRWNVGHFPSGLASNLSAENARYMPQTLRVSRQIWTTILLEQRKETKMSAKCRSDYTESSAFTAYRLRHHKRARLVYSRPKLTKLTWYAKTCKRSVEDDLAKRLLDLSKTSKKILVCFGDGSLKDDELWGEVWTRNRPFVRYAELFTDGATDATSSMWTSTWLVTTQCCARCTDRMPKPPQGRIQEFFKEGAHSLQI